LAPGDWFKSVDRPEYERLYAAQLANLDPYQVVADLQELAGGAEPVLLCWERPPFSATNFCHRRLVAAWLETHTGVVVDELDLSAQSTPARGQSAPLIHTTPTCT
jgi:hypothetical protein